MYANLLHYNEEKNETAQSGMECTCTSQKLLRFQGKSTYQLYHKWKQPSF